MPRLGRARLGTAGRTWLCSAGLGVTWHGRQDRAAQGKEWQGSAWLGLAVTA